MKKLFVVSLFVFLLALIFQTNLSKVSAASGDAQWAKASVSGLYDSSFLSVATDASGNIYAAGLISSVNQINFGNSVVANGAQSGDNVLIVKYNPEGAAQWARSVTGTGLSESRFRGIAVDSGGNAYAAGYITGTSQYAFGNGVTVTGVSSSESPIVVKYNSAGETQWAQSTVSGNVSSFFSDISLDSSGNVYAAGNKANSTVSIDFGNGTSVLGTYGGGNALLVKYSSAGVAQWAKTTEAGSNLSNFTGCATDSLGNIYASGYIYSTVEYNFGNNIKVNGTKLNNRNALIIKYNSAGVAQWAKSTVAGTDVSNFYKISVDNNGNAYVVGDIAGQAEFDFGNNIKATGSFTSTNPLLIKYNSAGVAQWAKTNIVGPDSASYKNISINSAGNIYVTGFKTGNGEFDFGNGITTTGGADGSDNGLIIEYNSQGVPQWAKSSTDYAEYNGIGTDNNGDVFLVGAIGKAVYNFGGSITASSPSWNGIFIAKYEGDMTSAAGDNDDSSESPSDLPVYTNLDSSSSKINLEEGQTVITNPYIIKVKPISTIGISKVEFYIDDILIGTATTPDSNGIYSCAWDTSKYHSDVKVIAYDINGATVTLTRSTTVNLLTVLPATGANIIF